MLFAEIVSYGINPKQGIEFIGTYVYDYLGQTINVGAREHRANVPSLY